jgi:hypothetical protein
MRLTPGDRTDRTTGTTGDLSLLFDGAFCGRFFSPDSTSTHISLLVFHVLNLGNIKIAMGMQEVP